jgi:hypothetical protein
VKCINLTNFIFYKNQGGINNLKQYLQHLTTLSSPEQGQPLILYVSTTQSIVSGVLVIEKDAAQAGVMTKQQYLVYFVLEVLVSSKSQEDLLCGSHVLKEAPVLF